jgi:hypothetical protein
MPRPGWPSGFTAPSFSDGLDHAFHHRAIVYAKENQHIADGCDIGHPLRNVSRERQNGDLVTDHVNRRLEISQQTCGFPTVDKRGLRPLFKERFDRLGREIGASYDGASDREILRPMVVLLIKKLSKSGIRADQQRADDGGDNTQRDATTIHAAECAPYLLPTQCPALFLKTEAKRSKIRLECSGLTGAFSVRALFVRQKSAVKPDALQTQHGISKRKLMEKQPRLARSQAIDLDQKLEHSG